MSIQQISRSTGSSRNLTQDFKKCRSDFRKAFPSSLENSTRELKFQSTAFHNNLEENKQDQLPPEWVDVYEKITEDLSRLEEKCKFYTVTKLKSVQAERMGIVFGDTSQKDREIEGLIQQTTKVKFK